MLHATEDIRLKWIKVVLPPVFLEEERREQFVFEVESQEKC